MSLCHTRSDGPFGAYQLSNNVKICYDRFICIIDLCYTRRYMLPVAVPAPRRQPGMMRNWSLSVQITICPRLPVAQSVDKKDNRNMLHTVKEDVSGIKERSTKCKIYQRDRDVFQTANQPCSLTYVLPLSPKSKKCFDLLSPGTEVSADHALTQPVD